MLGELPDGALPPAGAAGVPGGVDRHGGRVPGRRAEPGQLQTLHVRLVEAWGDGGRWGERDGRGERERRGERENTKHLTVCCRPGTKNST